MLGTAKGLLKVLDVIKQLAEEGFQVYTPFLSYTVNSAQDQVELLLKTETNEFREVSIHIAFQTNKEDLFFDNVIPVNRTNYWYLFYSEKANKTLLLSSEEYLKMCKSNIGISNFGRTTIKFHKQSNKYVVNDFLRMK